METFTAEEVIKAIRMRALWYSFELGEMSYEARYSREVLSAMTDHELVRAAGKLGLYIPALVK